MRQPDTANDNLAELVTDSLTLEGNVLQAVQTVLEHDCRQRKTAYSIAVLSKHRVWLRPLPGRIMVVLDPKSKGQTSEYRRTYVVDTKTFVVQGPFVSA